MTQREIVVRLSEAYIKAGRTVDICDIIRIADYIMAHTVEYAPYYTSISTTDVIGGNPYESISTTNYGFDKIDVHYVDDTPQENITL